MESNLNSEQVQNNFNIVKERRKRISFLIGGVFILYLIVSLFSGSSREDTSVRDAAKESSQEEQQVLAEEGTQDQSIALDPFLINLLDRDSSLKLSIQLELKKPISDLGNIDLLTAEIRDNIIGTASNKSVSDLLGSESKNQLKEEIRAIVDNVLGEKLVKKVLFNDFFIQNGQVKN